MCIRDRSVPGPGGPLSLGPLRRLTKVTQLILGATRIEDRELAVVAGLPTVSYTHLDVYKRQMLSVVDDPDVGPAVLKAYSSLPAELKAKAVNLLTHRTAWTKTLLDAIAAKQLPTSVLNVTHLRKLQQSRDPQIVAQVKACLLYTSRCV